MLALLQEVGRPAATAELARELGLHVNGIRRHLARLERAGHVERRRVAHGRGRPRDLWTLAADAPVEPPERSADLARWLARAVPAGPKGLRRVERTGRDIGRELAVGGPDEPARHFHGVLTALGFQPSFEQSSTAKLRCCLHNCPYVESVRENADVVCTLHRGITLGLLDELAPEAALATWEPKEPEEAACVADIAGSGWARADLEPLLVAD